MYQIYLDTGQPVPVALSLALTAIPCYPMLSHAIPCYPIACNQYLESKCDWLLDEIHFASDRAAVVTDGATISQGRRCTGTGSRSELLFGIW